MKISQLSNLSNVRLFDPFTKQISIMFLASTMANVSNYLFHFFMGRFLGPSEYGIMASLTSVFFIPFLFLLTQFRLSSLNLP